MPHAHLFEVRLLYLQFGEVAYIPKDLQKCVGRDHDIVAMGQEETPEGPVRYLWVVPNYRIGQWFERTRTFWFRGPPPTPARDGTRRRARPKPEELASAFIHVPRH